MRPDEDPEFDERDEDPEFEETGLPELQDDAPEQQWMNDPQAEPQPGEGPGGAEDYGLTAEEQAEGEPLDQRLERETSLTTAGTTPWKMRRSGRCLRNRHQSMWRGSDRNLSSSPPALLTATSAWAPMRSLCGCRAEEIAARTVNKQRARSGQTRQASKTATEDISAQRRGGIRSGNRYGPGGRTKAQLYADARAKGIRGRSKMSKKELEDRLAR